ADAARKAVGKKKRGLMAQMRDKFLAGLAESGTDRRVAQDLWSLMTAAADYSFNRSHAACYALIAYRTAYLRANYPAEYMAALISSVMSTKDKVPFFVNRCQELGIEVLPPDVNSSDHGFVVAGNRIRFGLDAAKNVGHAAVETAAPSHPPVPDGEFEQRELLRLEKETLGTFLSSHPLAEVRDPLSERVHCALAAVAGYQDGAWLTVGGIVTEAKRVRTRS